MMFQSTGSTRQGCQFALFAFCASLDLCSALTYVDLDVYFTSLVNNPARRISSIEKEPRSDCLLGWYLPSIGVYSVYSIHANAPGTATELRNAVPITSRYIISVAFTSITLWMVFERDDSSVFSFTFLPR